MTDRPPQTTTLDSIDVARARVSGVLPIYAAYWLVPWVFVVRGGWDPWLPAIGTLLAVSMVLFTLTLARCLRTLLPDHAVGSSAPQPSNLTGNVVAPAVGGLIFGIAYLAAVGLLEDAVPFRVTNNLVAGVVAIAAGLTLLVPVRALIVLVTAAAGLGWLVTQLPAGVAAAALAALVSVFVVRASVRQLVVMTELHRARLHERAWVVAEERLRVSRDLHDIAGRSLAAIALKSEIALKLAGQDKAQAWDQLRDVKELADTASREMRELSHGYRSVDLATELRSAQSLLRSTRIASALHGQISAVPSTLTEPFAWVVREGTANILRHSRATSVTINVSPTEISIINDGAASESYQEGAGLAGLRERIADKAGTLRSHVEAGSFTLAARFSPKEGVTA